MKLSEALDPKFELTLCEDTDELRMVSKGDVDRMGRDASTDPRTIAIRSDSVVGTNSGSNFSRQYKRDSDLTDDLNHIKITDPQEAVEWAHKVERSMSRNDDVQENVQESLSFDKFMDFILLKEHAGKKTTQTDTPQRAFAKKYREKPLNRIIIGSK